MKRHKNCQSCGMPLKKDPKGGGTNADGSLSQTYCSYCYVGGRFMQPDMTIDDMRVLVVEKLQEKGVPKFIARFFASNLHKLERWRSVNA